jgi:hypothetical protein
MRAGGHETCGGSAFTLTKPLLLDEVVMKYKDTLAGCLRTDNNRVFDVQSYKE